MTRPTLLMTRARAASVKFVAELDPDLMQGVKVLISPLLDIIPNQNAPSFERFTSAIFTSSNGAGLAPMGAGRTAYCVGARTAEQAKARGWRVEQVSQDAQELVEKLKVLAPTGPLLHIAGEHRRGEIAQRLSAAGIPTEVHVAYAQPLLPLSDEAKQALFGEGTVIVPLFSPRVAAQFASQAAFSAQVQILTISQAVAEALGTAYAERVDIVSNPTGEEMRRGVENLLRGDRLP